MSTDVFTFSNITELRAFECGVHFSEAPVETQTDGLLLTVTFPYGDEVREHHYVPIVFARTVI